MLSYIYGEKMEIQLFDEYKAKFLKIKEEYQNDSTNANLPHIVASTGTLLLSVANLLLSDGYYKSDLLQILFDQIDYFYDKIQTEMFFNKSKNY